MQNQQVVAINWQSLLLLQDTWYGALHRESASFLMEDEAELVPEPEAFPKGYISSFLFYLFH